MALIRQQLIKLVDSLRGLSFRRSRQKSLLQALDRNETLQRTLAETMARVEVRQGALEQAIAGSGNDATDEYNKTQHFRRDLLLILGRIENIEFNLEKLLNRQSLSYEVIAPQGANSYDEYAYWMLERHKRENIKRLCEYIASLSDEQCKDADFLEDNLIPRVGLAKGEASGSGIYNTWPPEVNCLRSGSLQMIQMPCQIAPYLAWLAKNVTGVNAYLEIGV